MKTNNTILRFIGRKLGVLILLTVSAVAFATLGDGKAKTTKSNKPLLSNKSQANSVGFSLRSGYEFRGSQVFNAKEKKYISINTPLSFQQGHTTYVLPMKRKGLDKITFNPNEATRR
ncbi:MAG TPA: hypothetical protein VF476_17835 [Chitinophagaceae bacterium]